MVAEAGFKNISADLIYGIPNQSLEQFENDLVILQKFDIPHISAYHLGIENNTYFGKLKKLGKIIEIADRQSELFYKVLIDWSLRNNYEHYEVSSFCKDSLYSRHNRAYWFFIPYLGFGPSAHSFLPGKRFFNISNLNRYLKALELGEHFYEIEILSPADRFNEYIMLGLRTKWGVNLNEIRLMIDSANYEKVMRSVSKLQDSNYLRIVENQLLIDEKFLFISDFIIRELILEN
jgi:oxygen-independent coproporphyrinogen-3 oxidase